MIEPVILGDCQLFLGDCLEVMKQLPDKSVDAVITDPPYGIGFKYDSGTEKANNPQEYWDWYQQYHISYMRILRDGGFWSIWQSGTYHRYLWDWFGDNTRIYIAAKNFVQLRPMAINHAYDPVAMGYKNGSDLLRPKNPPRSLDYSVANMAGIISDINRPEKEHPTPKNVHQVKHIMENFSLPNGIVFDPFMGSGTTGVACVQLGRKFIGCEIHEPYFDIAVKRIKQAQLQMRMDI